MTAIIDRVPTAIRQFSDYPAGSLPRLRFDLRIACKKLIRNDFYVRDEPRKNFFPEFSPRGRERERAALPCRSSSLRRRRRRLGDDQLGSAEGRKRGRGRYEARRLCAAPYTA